MSTKIKNVYYQPFCLKVKQGYLRKVKKKMAEKKISVPFFP